MTIFTALFGGSVGVGRLKIKKWMIYPISAAVVVLALFGAFWIYTHSAPFSRYTLEMARNAADHDDGVRAAELYLEACDEGSEEACVASDPVAQKRFFETECKKGDPKSCQSAREVRPSDWIPDYEKGCKQGDKASCGAVQKIKALD